MTGRAYTIKEMKGIVDYLTEHKAYGEIRGRKMWIDFANTQLTNRTWQSLKETFLKRIMPDLHNPYYKLTIEQVNSFRQGYDVAEKNKTKLEVHTISDDSSSSHSNAEKTKDIKCDTANSNEENNAGENKKCSKIPSKNRASADTVILDHYETIEDVQRDLESPTDNREEIRETAATKSLRDCITYSEPLTPILQEVLDDFASEPESDEPQMQIVENPLPEPDNTENTEQVSKSPHKTTNSDNSVAADVAKNAKGLSADFVEEVLLSEIKEINNQTTKNEQLSTKKAELNSVTDGDNKLDNQGEKANGNTNLNENVDKGNTKEVLQEATLEILENTGNSIVSNVNQNNVSNLIQQNSSEKESSIQSNITPDSLLPNNPEAFGKRTSYESDIQTQKNSTNILESSDEPKVKSLRKRVANHDDAIIQNVEKKKKKLENKVTTLETDKDKTTISESVLEKPLENETPDNVNTDINRITSPILKSDTKPEAHKPKSPEKASRNKKLTLQTVETRGNKNIPILREEPSTSKTAQAATVTNATPVTAEIENPCLKNVSLFDEQFNSMKYNSGSSDTEVIQKVSENEEANIKNNDIVMLKSNSDSDEHQNNPVSMVNKPIPGTSKNRRDVALANVFGFSSGAIGTHGKRRLSRTKKTAGHSATHTNGTNTSEWTSESESEMYVSPPRSRKNRPTRKYLKPQSARILSLEEEGGLFVMYGKKIYPLVKDGKMVKNYLKYTPDSESEEESFWKLKYVEEKKKSDELKRLLEHTKETRRDSRSPDVPSKSSRKSHRLDQKQQEPEKKDKQISNQGDKNRDAAAKTEETIKIKFTKNNEELHLEGHWPQIHPVLEQVVNIFHKENETAPAARKASHSGFSTPVIVVDQEVHEKVDQLEKQIFQEIEAWDKQETVVEKTGTAQSAVQSTLSPAVQPTAEKTPETTPQTRLKTTPQTTLKTTPQTTLQVTPQSTLQVTPQSTEENGEKLAESGPETNVTKSVVDRRRRGRPRKSSSSTTGSPAKKPRTPDLQITAPENDVTTTTAPPEPETKTERTVTRRSATPRKILNETANTTETRTVQTRKSKSKPEKVEAANEDDDVRYMFPPKNKRQTTKQAADKEQKPQKSSVAKTAKIYSSPENFSINSVDSTQGYQDSDISPVRADLRKKKLNSRSSYTIRNKHLLRRNSRRKSHPYLHCDASNDSSNSSTSAPMFTAQNSSLNTDVYRSESYQLLMPQQKQSFVFLERIDEISPSGIGFGAPKKEGHANSDVASSSNVSLPLSPELSVVENLSVSKELLSNIAEQTSINKTQCNNMTEHEFCNKFLISGLDVSVPLMQQDCDFESCNMNTMEQSTASKNMVTDSLLNNINICNIRDQTPVTGMLNQRLQNLLLESAKKIGEESTEKMEVDSQDVATEPKAKTKKRCSTPRKRKSTKKSTAPKVDVVEEVRVESCALGGRNSCPPILQDFPNDLDEEINIANLTINTEEKLSSKQKKDVIKVKILRPRSKDKSNKPAKSTSRMSVFTDSGINDTESSVFLQVDDSVDLIHNHSETCLLANECVGDSVEFVNNSKSVISLSSNSNEWQTPLEFTDAENIMAPEFFDNIAEDLKSLCNEIRSQDTSNTVYHSPIGTEISNNSIVTDDLSDEPQPPPKQPSKWYLFSEDENTSQTVPKDFASGSFGANLKQIFPITCAIPDLSTITEISKDNDDSRKPTLDTDNDTRDDLNSLGAFDSNF